MSVESKIDDLTILVQDQSADIAKITTVLGGSGMGDKGLIEQMSDLTGSHYKTKSEVSRLKWIVTGIATGISTIWAGAVAWYNNTQ